MNSWRRRKRLWKKATMLKLECFWIKPACALAELESARHAAEDYQQISVDWEIARQKAQDVLELFPQYPDPTGIFVTLGLCKARRQLPPPAELVRQAGLGALLGVPSALLVFYLAFLYITRR